MKISLLIILSLFSINVFCQENYLIKYKSIKDSDTYMIGDDILYYEPITDFSVYYEGENIFLDSRISNDSVRFVSGDYYYTFFQKEELYFRSNIFNKELKVKEKIPNFNWDISSETKTKYGVELHKATTSFRGRNYTAWYNPEIPIKAGPWKFNGLPGLIYEVYDDAKEFKFSWFLSSIEKSEPRKFKTNLFKNTISIKQFSEELDEAHVNYKSTTDARLPENFTVTETIIIGNQNHRQKKREIKYEWEN